MTPVVINFDSLSDGEIVDDQFVGLGVDFNGLASILDINTSLNPPFPPQSGTNVIYDDPNLSSGTIQANAIGDFWSSAGAYVTGNTNVTLTAYDIGNNILGTDSTGGSNFVGAGTGLLPNIFLSVTANDIAYVTFSDSGNTYTVDDFTFVSSAIPEPLTILGVGTASAFGTFFKRKLSKNNQNNKTEA